MDSLDFNKVSISKAYNFKNINGKYCHINYDETKLEFEITGTIAFDVNKNYPKPNLFIYLTKEIEEFENSLKKRLTQLVSNNSKYIYGEYLDLAVSSDFYCSPHKTIQKGKKFLDVLKLKIILNENIPEELPRNKLVKMKVHVSGMWFAENSYGPYFNVTNIEVLEKEKKSYFLEDPDSEIDL
jgi:hypothetical protein